MTMSPSSQSNAILTASQPRVPDSESRVRHESRFSPVKMPVNVLTVIQYIGLINFIPRAAIPFLLSLASLFSTTSSRVPIKLQGGIQAAMSGLRQEKLSEGIHHAKVVALSV